MKLATIEERKKYLNTVCKYIDKKPLQWSELSLAIEGKFTNECKDANKEQSQDLIKELESIGYDLDILNDWAQTKSEKWEKAGFENSCAIDKELRHVHRN